MRVQNLTATGSKAIACKVKLYDFALYTNPQQLQAACAAPRVGASPAQQQSTCTQGSKAADPASGNSSSLSLLSDASNVQALANAAEHVDTIEAKSSRRAKKREKSCKRQKHEHGSDAITSRVLADGSIEMSVAITMARDLPLNTVRKDFERILSNRMKAVGGGGGSVKQLMSNFNTDALPSSAMRGKCIRKGTPVNFSRSRRGTLTATVASEMLASVDDKKLCQAMFDLYLGDPPVSGAARRKAAAEMQKMLDNGSSSGPTGAR